MKAFAYSSYKHQSDQELLDGLGRAIFVLKLQAQNQLPAYGLDASALDEARAQISDFLDHLAQGARLLVTEPDDEAADVDMAFAGLADRFVNVNPSDVPDRTAELLRLRDRLSRERALKERDFCLLDGLHGLLEQEAAEGVRGLYAL